MTFTAFKEYKRSLLEKRGLSRPDGRSLYEYRLTSNEFEELEGTLRTWLGRIIGVYNLGDILKLTGFPALFVLYSAEWWRRRYDGSGFSWEPILRDLGVAADSWTPGERSQCVKDGLASWGLAPRRQGALRFLGAIAVQGGLPLRLLGEARSGVGKLLQRVLQLAEGREVADVDVRGWIESLCLWLPKSYRQDIIYALLTDMVLVVLQLKQEAGLSIGDDAVAVLDRKIPRWKERFPLSLDDRHARSLVEQLVKDAANVRVRKIKPCLPVERFIEQGQDGGWQLASRIELPDTLEEKALAQIFNIEPVDLPRTATLSVLAGEHSRQTSVRKLAGRSMFRLESAEWRFDGSDALEEHVLQLSAADGRTWVTEAHKGELLDEDLPWVFAEEAPISLLKQGSGRVAPTQVLLAIPESWHLQEIDGGTTELIGNVNTPQRNLFRVQGKTKITTFSGLETVIHTGQASAAEQQLVWSGNRFWLDFISPRRAYKGIPQIYRVDDTGSKQHVNGRPVCSVLGAPQTNQALGPVVLKYPSTGEAQIRTQMVLLPEDASLELAPDTARSGQISFINWGLANASLFNASQVQQHIHQQNDTLTLRVAANGSTRTPESVVVDLYWPHTIKAVRVRLPYPARGVRAFNGKNQEIQSGDLLSIKDLLGVRLIVNIFGARKPELDISANGGQMHRRCQLRFLPGTLVLDIPLVDYLADIQHMLSMDDSPDSLVSVSVLSDRQSVFKLNIARYAAVMERDASLVYIEKQGINRLEIEQIEQWRVQATRLEYPSDEPIELKPVLSEGVPTGSWQFEPETKEPGTWLVYPAPENKELFRACIWPIEGEITTDDVLIEAMSTSQQNKREEQIAEVISKLASDFLHPSWLTVDQLANQFGHLSLATLDLWRIFSRSFRGMAALALRMGNLPKNFYLRFAREMPFTWETVTLQGWKQSIGQLKMQCHHQYGDIADQIFHRHFENCSQLLGAECGALNFSLGVAGAEFDEKFNKEYLALKFAIAPTAEKDLFEGADSELMNLRRRHAEDEWPTGFDLILKQARNDVGIQHFLYEEPYGFPDGVINMPLIAAAAAAMNKSDQYFSHSENVHLLRTFRAFDMDWFDAAYNLTIARCLAEGGCDD